MIAQFIAEQPEVAGGPLPSIAVVGLGRVGMSLGRALRAAGYIIPAVWNRSSNVVAERAVLLDARPAASAAEAVRAADLTLLTVSDDAITQLAGDIAREGAWHNRAVVHASGVLGREALSPAARGGALTGALHPLAAFAHIQTELPHGIAFAVEAPEPLRAALTRIALDLGGRPLVLDAEDKALYHAAAVMASNYSVTLAAVAARLLRRVGASEDDSLRVLLPLMRSTLDNLERQGLPAALTGPIVRGDTGTVRRHLLELDAADAEAGTLYRCLALGTLPLAALRGLDDTPARALNDLLRLPGEMLNE